MLAFAVLAGLVTAMVCGIVPALRASRTDVMDVLRSVGGRSGGLRGGRRLRSGVVVTEVALSFILLVGAGLMLRSVVALAQVNPGLRSEPRPDVRAAVASAAGRGARGVHAAGARAAARDSRASPA